jgi:nitroreductase
MKLFEAIEKRASVRELLPANVSNDEIRKILDAGRRAPSGKNAQPLEYIVIKNHDTIKKLEKVQPFIAGASVVIAIVADPSSRFWLEDASAAAENMFLAITALGYVSCWVEGTLLAQEEWAKELLGVPHDRRLIILLPVGKPATTPVPKEKKPLAHMVYAERYGTRMPV